MPLTPLAPIDTRPFFRPVCAELSALLPSLSPDDWLKTAVGRWRVRDLVAHMIDVALRRLAFQRDGHTPPPPPFPIRDDRDFARFINQINDDWVRACGRLSTKQLAEAYEAATWQLAEFVETLPLDGPGLFGVSWAGEMQSANWFDIGREFTEQWHHQAQIREAIGAPPLHDPKWLWALLQIAMRALPHHYRDRAAAGGTAIAIDVSGLSGGAWTLIRTASGWELQQGRHPSPAARAAMTDETAWRWLHNRLSREQAARHIQLSGDTELLEPLAGARAIVI